MGRPRKGFRRDGSGLKLSAGLEIPTMEAGCRLYDMGLWLPDMHGAARAHARRRSFQCTVLRRGVPNSVPPPSSPSRWTSWLRSTASSTSDSRGVQTERAKAIAEFCKVLDAYHVPWEVFQWEHLQKYDE